MFLGTDEASVLAEKMVSWHRVFSSFCVPQNSRTDCLLSACKEGPRKIDAAKKRPSAVHLVCFP